MLPDLTKNELDMIISNTCHVRITKNMKIKDFVLELTKNKTEN